MVLGLPTYQGRGPGKATSERGETNYIIFLDFSLRPGLAHGDRNGGGGGISVAHDVVVDLVVGQSKFLLYVLAYPQVCLVRYQQVDVFRFQAVGLKRLVNDLGESYNGMLEYLATVHIDFEPGCVSDLLGLPLAPRPAAARVLHI